MKLSHLVSSTWQGHRNMKHFLFQMSTGHPSALTDPLSCQEVSGVPWGMQTTLEPSEVTCN